MNVHEGDSENGVTDVELRAPNWGRTDGGSEVVPRWFHVVDSKGACMVDHHLLPERGVIAQGAPLLQSSRMKVNFDEEEISSESAC